MRPEMWAINRIRQGNGQDSVPDGCCVSYRQGQVITSRSIIYILSMAIITYQLYFPRNSSSI
jgi:hypothetical protein